jgi:hypothetical protein
MFNYHFVLRWNSANDANPNSKDSPRKNSSGNKQLCQGGNKKLFEPDWDINGALEFGERNKDEMIIIHDTRKTL